MYREILRVLKPGGMFVSYEWCLTKVHDPANEKHVRSKRLIEEGDGLPDLMPTGHCDESLAKAGFEFLEGRDAALDPNPSGVPWFTILTPSFVDIFRLQFTCAAPSLPLPTRHQPRTPAGASGSAPLPLCATRPLTPPPPLHC